MTLKTAVLVTTLGAALSLPAYAQQVSAPSVVGWIAGPLATSNPSDQPVSGTDLGWTFEHRGQLFILFGDSWNARSLCGPALSNDDAQGTLPLSTPAGAPAITFFTRAESPQDFDGIRIYRNGESLSMAELQVPVAGFSDGVDAFAVFSREDYEPCVRASADEPGSCPTGSGAAAEAFACAAIAECAPPLVSLLCDPATSSGCLFFQHCGASSAGYCVDRTSSQYIGSAASDPFAAVNRVDIGVQRPSDPVAYDSIAVWETNKFLNVTARTVAAFTGTSAGNDYRPGHAAVFMWGRPGFWAEHTREAQVYLMAHPLPFPTDAAGQRQFSPQYFAGTDPLTHEPIWTPLQAKGVPLSMDGLVGGSPHEALPLPGQMGISWVPEPVNKWVMLYGGDAPDLYLSEPLHDRPGPAPGSIRIRFADHPWGPWTPARPLLIPGAPTVVGDPYGPGGFMFHTKCRSQGDGVCAPNTIPTCVSAGLVQIGRLYAPNIIDLYTQPDGAGGVTIYWNVSAYNPYGVLLMKTTIRPAAACKGDCGGDGQVTVDEVITLVNIALDSAQASACPSGVPAGAAVDITLIVQAVNSALSECAG